MRRLVMMSAVIAGIPWIARAQQCEAPPAYTPAPVCYAPPAAPAPAPTPAPPAPVGNFLRGPATGQAAGETRSFGIRGARIHFPEITISLPTIEFPTPVKFRRDAEMLFDTARGPLSTAAVQEFGALPSPAPNPAPLPAPAPTPAPVCVPYTAPACGVPAPAGCTSDARALELERRLAHLDQLERELVALRDQYSQRMQSAERMPTSTQRENVKSNVPASSNGRPGETRPWFAHVNYEEESVFSTTSSSNVAPPRLTTGSHAVTKTPSADEDGFGRWISRSNP